MTFFTVVVSPLTANCALDGVVPATHISVLPELLTLERLISVHIFFAKTLFFHSCQDYLI